MQELSPTLKRLILSIGILFILSIGGIIGFKVIEEYGYVDAIYMTVITMSTVGFGTVHELSAAGKLFASGLIITSAGTFIYAITNITTFVVEGELNHIFKRFRVSNKVSKLNSHIILCGLGRNGREAANELLRQGHAFVCIDESAEVGEDFLEHHPDSLLIVGDATSEEILERANIRNARGLITALAGDAENVYITLTAREMNPKIKIVARAAQASTISKLKRAGANEVILPNLIGGRKMANLITRPALVEFVEMVSGEGGHNLHLEVFSCAGQPKLLGKTLAELHVRAQVGATIIGRKSGGKHVELNPEPHKILEPEDRLFVVGNEEQLVLFQQTYLE
ncbi:MAG: potassium channel protein [Bacteroidota bacterium]